jgi:hypothetical protein
MISMDHKFKHKTNDCKYFISCQNCGADDIQETGSILVSLRIQKLIFYSEELIYYQWNSNFMYTM